MSRFRTFLQFDQNFRQLGFRQKRELSQEPITLEIYAEPPFPDHA